MSEILKAERPEALGMVTPSVLQKPFSPVGLLWKLSNSLLHGRFVIVGLKPQGIVCVIDLDCDCALKYVQAQAKQALSSKVTTALSRLGPGAPSSALLGRGDSLRQNGDSWKHGIGDAPMALKDVPKVIWRDDF